ncbi:pyrimidine 5'-nucleotidase [Anncaliia algerae PRA339]|uniref:Pyrimidine 5'-nucleotidase n=1 Tax=Anncaliia algerae PRA339 TaxID=1288291 RepID=A0A059F0I0_9MICR|nr:pyrimidine 5'-nucleotidase [Anncaliia algerae PRA339]
MTTERANNKYLYIEDLELLSPQKTPKALYIFDIDETLYPSNKIIKMNRFEELNCFSDVIGMPKEDRISLYREYEEKYGTVIGGILANYDLTEKDYEILINKVENIKVDLIEDALLKNMLSKIEGTMICLTNGEKAYAKEVLSRLGLEELFEKVICCNYLKKYFLCKPQEEVYEILERFFNITGKNIYFFDDKRLNLHIPEKKGWNVYHVTEEKDIKYFLNKLIGLNQ